MELFLYEALRRKRIYGGSTYPFSLQDPAHAVRYEEGKCPNCEAALNEMLTVPLHESWGESELQDIVAAPGRRASRRACLAVPGMRGPAGSRAA